MSDEERAIRIGVLVDRYREIAEIERDTVSELFELIASDAVSGRRFARFGHGDGPGPADILWMNCWDYDSPESLRRRMAQAIAPFGRRLIEFDAPCVRQAKG